MSNTKFADDEAMKSIGVFDGVKVLFTNIGWQWLLEWDDIGYKRTTLEFLSSVIIADKVLHFHLFNKASTLTMHQICIMINAPIQETFNTTDSYHSEYNEQKFWRTITAKSKFEARNAKASQIVHPTLRVAHRLLSCIVSSRLDTGSVTQQELYLLWCMIHPQTSKPNFGEYLCQKLLKVAKAPKGAICCTSVITVLGRHPSLHHHFPNNMGELTGARYLDTD